MKPAIPDRTGLPQHVKNVLDQVAENIDVISGRRGTKLPLLNRNATTADIVNAFNSLVELLQDSKAPAGAQGGARASEWTKFPLSVFDHNTGNPLTIIDHGSYYRIADRTVFASVGFTITNTNGEIGYARFDLPSDAPITLPLRHSAMACRENAVIGAVMWVIVLAGTRQFIIGKYDNTTSIITNARYDLAGFYLF